MLDGGHVLADFSSKNLDSMQKALFLAFYAARSSTKSCPPTSDVGAHTIETLNGDTVL